MITNFLVIIFYILSGSLIGYILGCSTAVVYCLWKYGPPDDESIIPNYMKWYYKWWLNRG